MKRRVVIYGLAGAAVVWAIWLFLHFWPVNGGG